MIAQVRGVLVAALNRTHSELTVLKPSTVAMFVPSAAAVPARSLIRDAEDAAAAAAAPPPFTGECAKVSGLHRYGL